MEIVDLIRSLKKKFGTTDPFVLCEYLNIEVKYVDFLDNPRGRYDTILGDKIIFLSNKIKDSNDRFFICGHELGHGILHSDIASYYSLNSHSKSKTEREANQFSSLLIKELYFEDHDQYPSTVNELSSLYGLPEEYFYFLKTEKAEQCSNTDQLNAPLF
ncbi:ImmA/IrrE family metallo-endopeptidase [Candidatus Enterococcus clewellii]|uniref:IrrE N-terminal-like domain-containing protein n=1 Tax=Candidatus Enterococcus clewellii TaxID=1834193 RepID=A0A242K3B9_9ENTE|nr:ImmA/IrrE family metallo-endopeptidase [Enterococcus sp. 9E7_DIV0242]OTP13401.1 hypothetical protein A5888_002879 [Enterococcus sp. 9E7_DIV0242]